MASQPKLSALILKKAAKLGLIITDPNQFVAAADIDVLLISKNHLLTSPIHRVAKARLAYDSPLEHSNDLISLAASVEQYSEHPFALAILAEARRLNVEIGELHDFMVMPGHGVSAHSAGQTILLGGPAMLNARNIPIYVDDLVEADAANHGGRSVVFVVIDNKLVGRIEIDETLLPDAAAKVNELHAKKIRVAMVTGEATGVAQHIAKELNIGEVFAEVAPHRRNQIVQKLKADGSKVAFASRNESDGLALSEAHVAIALESDGSDRFRAAGLHLPDCDLTTITAVIALAKLRKNIDTSMKYGLIAAILIAVGIAAIVVGTH